MVEGLSGRGRPECKKRHFRRAVDPHGHVHRSYPPAHEHRRLVARSDACDDGKFLRGDSPDERQDDLSAMGVSGEDQWHVERGRFG